MALIWIRANYPRSQPERSSLLLHMVPDMLLLGNRKEAALPQIRLKLQLFHKIFKSHPLVIGVHSRVKEIAVLPSYNE